MKEIWLVGEDTPDLDKAYLTEEAAKKEALRRFEERYGDGYNTGWKVSIFPDEPARQYLYRSIVGKDKNPAKPITNTGWCVQSVPAEEEK